MAAVTRRSGSLHRAAAASWAGAVETGLGRAVEAVAAVLVAVEIAVLLAGIISRYVFNNPSSGPTSWPRCCSSGWRCWARWWRCGAASTCG